MQVTVMTILQVGAGEQWLESLIFLEEESMKKHNGAIDTCTIFWALGYHDEKEKERIKQQWSLSL